MWSLFSLIRAGLLGVVTAWTFIVLGIAIHFQQSFESSPQLTYVSLAVFVSATTLAIFLCVLFAPCNKLIGGILKTKWELVWLGILSALWLSLAGFTTTSVNKDTEIECWSEEDGNVTETGIDGYNEEIYHARFRVLQAFSFFNAILLIALFMFILLLALWHHKRGRFAIWTTRTTFVDWFDTPSPYAYGRGRSRLPPPVTEKSRKKGEKYHSLDDEKKGKKGKGEVDEMGYYFKDSKSKQQDNYTPAIARRDPSSRPAKNTVYVPAKEAKKPALGASGGPIAAKMLAAKNAPARPEPARQGSQRELLDVARTQARRDRPEEPAIRRQESGRRPNVTAAAAAPAVARPEAKRTQTQPTAGHQRQQSQPAIVRQTSQTRPNRQDTGAKRPALDRNQTTGTGAAKAPGATRPSGRRP